MRGLGSMYSESHYYDLWLSAKEEIYERESEIEDLLVRIELLQDDLEQTQQELKNIKEFYKKYSEQI